MSHKLRIFDNEVISLGLIDNPVSFTEFYALDFNDDVVLMGHDGPGRLGIA